MVRILRDEDLLDRIDLRAVVATVEEGYRADARGEVVLIPRQRAEASGTSIALLGAAVPRADLLGFRSYLDLEHGGDRGEQLVAIYRHSTGELRGLFVGRLVGNLRTGAAVAAAVHLAEPDAAEFGLIGTGGQARNALAAIATTFHPRSVVAWSPDAGHRAAFRAWARRVLQLEVRLEESASGVVQGASVVALLTSASSPVLSAAMLPAPRLLVSISAYRRPELDAQLLDGPGVVWTDSVVQATGPGTLLASAERRARVRPLGDGVRDGALRDGRTTRLVINTGAAWEEVLVGGMLVDLADTVGLGVEVRLPKEPPGASIFGP
jgi:ornithine cyclodeaminase/alanine dehydrogenase-like protein (mu-crystallin family)